MSQNTIFITAASWEPRFIEGAKRISKHESFTACRCLWFAEYGERTASARQKLSTLVGGIDHREIELQLCAYSPPDGSKPTPTYVSTWRAIHEMMAESLPGMDSFILDITTMPREALWITLDFLTEARMPGRIYYHQAKKYGAWCGCEPDRPHMVPKLGGISSLDGPTKLLIISGYDEDRSEQLIASFEPDETRIVFQEGHLLGNREKNERQHRKRFGQRRTIGFDSVDCYSADWGFSKIHEIVSEFASDQNLILASLGPKTSAVALYRLQRHFPQSGLIYSPCRSYNIDYSEGTGESLTLEWVSSDMVPLETRVI